MDAELLPPQKQALWGRLAVANFFLGGAGAGAYVIAAAVSGFAPTPLLRAISVVGPLLVLLGFASVAAEAGRPFRGPRVLRQVRSSWMSRELWAGGVFVGLVGLDIVSPSLGWRLGAVLAAGLFALAQGWLLADCRGVTAWSMPAMAPLFLLSALASGAGVLGLALPAVGATPGREELALITAALVASSGLGWLAYQRWPGDPAFRRAVATFREDWAIVGIFVVGHVLPLGILLGALLATSVTPAAAGLAGIGILLGQLQAKARLVLRAGALRPITMPHFTIRIPGVR